MKSLGLVSLATILGLSACTVGPNYRKPEAIVSPVFKESVGWKKGEPFDAIDRGAWWLVFHDPALDALERKIEISNQTLKQYEAAYRQARAAVDQERAGLFPAITGDGSFSRSHSGSGRTGLSGIKGLSTSSTADAASVTASTTWELDLWGRIRRTVEADVASAQASAADLANAKLSAQAALATDYFELRYQDRLKRLLDATTADYQRSLEITQNRYNQGVAAKADVLTAQTQLLNAQSQSVNAEVQRANLEHAIAVLTGQPPADLAMPSGDLAEAVPVAPTGVPSALLERRPDIAAAERTMASANARIGVAVAAYFPALTLSPSYGTSASTLGKLFAASTATWSVGGSLADTILDFGARSAQVEQARALYDQDVATYRQTVLTALQQVEDALSTLRILERQNVIEAQLVAAAQEAARLTLNQYKAGTVPFSSVISAQTTALSAEQTALSVTENRLTASVSLIEALGGGWDSSQLPPRDQVEDDSAFLHMIPITGDHKPVAEDAAK